MPTSEHAQLLLADAINALNSDLELDKVLDTFLEAAREMTGAQYAALNVIDSAGRSLSFIVKGMDSAQQARIGHPPGRVGVLGQIPDTGTLVVESVRTHPAHEGMPADHPELGSFLGTALNVRGAIYGYLYLADKPGGFDAKDEKMIQTLASGASIAVDHAKLYDEAIARERWLTASQRIVTRLLADYEQEEVLQEIVEAACELADAATAALVLPGIDDTWVMEFTSGDGASALIGLELPPEGRGMEVIRSGIGLVSPLPPGSAVLQEITAFGPSMYAPLVAHGNTLGLLMLWREQRKQEFGEQDLTIAQRFASQAAVALSMAELTQMKNVSALLEERERLADDLHDFVSQELFATAMQLEAIAAEASPEVSERLGNTLDHVKRAQHEVRGVMGALSGQRSAEPASQRAQREITMARDTLGFAPRVNADWASLDDAIANDGSLGDDLIAVIRELLSNVARHAQATQVSLEVSAEEGRVEIRVTDNGKGPSGATQRHSGTSNLANRALRRNGTFSLVEHSPGDANPGCIATWNVQAEF